MEGHEWKCECGESFRTLMEWDDHAEICVGEMTEDESGFYDKPRRAEICANSMQGVDDPAAFMQDAHALRDLLEAYKEDESTENFLNLVAKEIEVCEHLKGA